MSHRFIGTGKRVNAIVYQDLLRQHVVPWIQQTHLDSNSGFKQFLRETMAEFWTLADWPPYLPDLNPLDFSI
jgi:hypothetical protein